MLLNNSIFSRRFQVVLFSLSVLALAYWCTGLTTNVYRYPALGAIFEITLFPMLAALAVIPVVSLVILFKEKRGWFFSLPFYALLFIIAAITFIILYR